MEIGFLGLYFLAWLIYYMIYLLTNTYLQSYSLLPHLHTASVPAGAGLRHGQTAPHLWADIWSQESHQVRGDQTEFLSKLTANLQTSRSTVEFLLAAVAPPLHPGPGQHPSGGRGSDSLVPRPRPSGLPRPRGQAPPQHRPESLVRGGPLPPVAAPAGDVHHPPPVWSLQQGQDRRAAQ